MKNSSFKKFLAVNFTKDQALVLIEQISNQEFHTKFEESLDQKIKLLNKEINLKFKLLNMKLFLVFLGIALLEILSFLGVKHQLFH